MRLRLTKVVLGVTAACTLAGAAAGIICGIPLSFILDGTRDLFDPLMYVLTGTVGAACGLLIGPATVFGFLRRVPLGRLFVQTSLGAALGGLLGFTTLWFTPGALLVAAAGFAAAAAHLAWHYRAQGKGSARAITG